MLLKMKRNWLLIVLTSLFLTGLFPFTAFSEETTKTLYLNSYDKDCNDKIVCSLNDDSIDIIKIIFKDILDTDRLNSTVNNDVSLSAITTKTRYAKNRRSSGQYNGTNCLKFVEGDPDVTISISRSFSVSNSYSCNYSVSSSSISSAVGFSVTSSSSINVSGSWKVPKKVKKGRLSVYPVYQKYTYDVYEKTSRGGVVINNKKLGNGTASKCVGYYFTKKRTSIVKTDIK